MTFDKIKLKSFLAAKGEYQYRFAKELGITESQLSKIMRGRVQPSQELIKKIDRITGDLKDLKK